MCYTHAIKQSMHSLHSDGVLNCEPNKLISKML